MRNARPAMRAITPTTWSICARVWPAFIMKRRRAWPTGAAGNWIASTWMPSRRSSMA